MCVIKLRANFPHLSSTRLIPFIDNLENKYPKLYDQFISANPAGGRFIEIKNEEEKKVIDIFSWVKRLVSAINYCREDRLCETNTYDKMYNLLSQFQYLKAANCGENAKLSELIMRLNGRKNVYTAAIKVGNQNIDHVVCFFNKDGSPFKKIDNNNTIIIDSWLGEADFANNMLVRYRNIYKDFLSIPKNGRISFRQKEHLILTKTELAQLASEFPQLLK